MAHPTLTLGDQLVATIEDAWSPTSPSAVERLFDVPITPENASELQGRRVYVLPAGVSDEQVTRAQKLYRHRFVIVVVEKFDETVSGLPSVAWADAIAEWVLDLKEWIDFPQAGQILRFGSPARSVWTESFEEIEIYDPDLLMEHSLFWSRIEVVYGEVL